MSKQFCPEGLGYAWRGETGRGLVLVALYQRPQTIAPAMVLDKNLVV